MSTQRVTLTNFIYICTLIVLLLSVPSNQQQLQQQHVDDTSSSTTSVDEVNFYEATRKLLLEGDAETIGRSADNYIKSVPYFRASIPMRIFECIREYSVLRCTKLFVLQKMEERKSFADSGNVTRDFLDQFFGQEEHMGSLISGKLANITEKELNQRLVLNFQRFFKNRDIKLHFLPGIMVKIVPSKENKLKFTLKKKTKSHHLFSRRSKQYRAAEENISVDETDALAVAKRPGGGGGIRKKGKNKKHSYKHTIIQMAVPVLIMPAILMGTFLPFILPVLKMATFMSMMMNNSAFIAALIYAARTHANSQEETPQHINYGHPGGYH